MLQGGRVTVTTEMATSYAKFHFGVVRTADRFVHVTVHDEGCGITRERLAHVFEPLFTTKKSGVGLGLAITYQVITSHGGHIFVDSEAGRGTTFHIFLLAAFPEEPGVDGEPSAGAKLRRVLLVEDEEAVAAGLAMLLELEGTRVEIVHSGAEAVPAIERFDPDVVVLDIGLPDMDGVEVFRQIEARWPGLPVLFFSGHADSAKLEHDFSQPNVGFLLKPYDFEVLLARLGQLVDNARAAA